MSDVETAARRLAAGDVIGFPTETVYGLGADALNETAVARIFAMKGRPVDHPLIAHFADPAALDEWAVEVPAQARALSRSFWPGPLTMIVRKSPRVPAAVTGGQETVGLRCPSHPLAQALLRAFGRVGSGLVAAPSANRFGHVSATSAEHVRGEFGNELYVLDGGPCEVGLESTIVDLSRADAVLLRPGGIAREALEQALGRPLRDRDAAAPRASGTLDAHYAPRTPLVLVRSERLEGGLIRKSDVAVLAMRRRPPSARSLAWITAPADARRYGHDLYANLRRLDASGAARILVEEPPDTRAWEAVNDRLRRAASGAVPDDECP